MQSLPAYPSSYIPFPVVFLMRWAPKDISDPVGCLTDFCRRLCLCCTANFSKKVGSTVYVSVREQIEGYRQHPEALRFYLPDAERLCQEYQNIKDDETRCEALFVQRSRQKADFIEVSMKSIIHDVVSRNSSLVPSPACCALQ